MKNRKILICGVFDFVNMATGGQPVKTRELYYALCDKYGKDDVDYIEIDTWKRKPLTLLISFFLKSYKSTEIIMLPAHNGVIVFSLLLLIAKKMCGLRIYYDVIGGWIAEKVKTNGSLKSRLVKFDGIWVETSTMKFALESQGFSNVSILPNFKRLKPITLDTQSTIYSPPYKLITFSRVMEEKGIGDAIKAVSQINEEYGSIVFTLDIYGDVDPSYHKTFHELLLSAKDYVSYKGIARPEDSVNIISPYFALLFPTRFYTEGIPGTIIDAYFAGVPVISADWINSQDVVDHGSTGLLYKFGDYNAFVETLTLIKDKPDIIAKMKSNCIIKARLFTPLEAIKTIEQLIK